ncbi:MAG: lipoxygenase family protein [Prolixibacteraceae bacterium]
MKHEEIKEIIRDCSNKTRIRYGYKGSFFTPKLKSINHLEVGHSKIISSPVTIFLEFLYWLKNKIRDFFQQLRQKLFPRPERIYGKKYENSITGKLLFAKKADRARPIHHIRIEFWARSRMLKWRKLSTDLTGQDGHFELKFDLSAAKRWSNSFLCIEIYQTTHIFFRKDKPHPHQELFKRIRIHKDDLADGNLHLQDIHLFYWEYRDDFPTARVVIKDHDKDAPQYYSQARCDAASEQIIPFELTKLSHLAKIQLAPESVSLESIQNDYPINLTRCIESKLPGYTRSDEYFGNRLMNGMYRGAFLPDKLHAGHFWIKYFGACQYDVNSDYAFPDAEIKLEIRPDGLPVPLEIVLSGPLNAYEKNPGIRKIFTPADKQDWEYAKRIARVNGGVSAEIDEHFTGTHLNTEQYAIAAYRNLRINPIATLMLPHLKEVVLINHSADKLLLTDFLPEATALTKKGLAQRVTDLLGAQDWKNYQPMIPISEAHDLAKSDKLFWEITGQYVDNFIDVNLEEICRNWFEIYCFSNDLVEHSVKVFMSGGAMEKLSPEEKKQAIDRMEYYFFKYSFNPSLKRETSGGELKAISRVTRNNGSEEVSQEDIQNLKDLCRYIIFVATYLHTWINEHQYDDLGELLYNCVGLRFGDGEKGVLAPESDSRIAPDLVHATQTLWFANLLSRTEFGFITRNEEGDVNPLFSKMLLDKKNEFLLLGVDVNSIESRTNI